MGNTVNGATTKQAVLNTSSSPTSSKTSDYQKGYMDALKDFFTLGAGQNHFNNTGFNNQNGAGYNQLANWPNFGGLNNSGGLNSPNALLGALVQHSLGQKVGETRQKIQEAVRAFLNNPKGNKAQLKEKLMSLCSQLIVTMSTVDPRAMLYATDLKKHVNDYVNQLSNAKGALSSFKKRFDEGIKTVFQYASKANASEEAEETDEATPQKDNDKPNIQIEEKSKIV